MLSKDQASAIAESLTAGALSERRSTQEAEARRIPYVYRSAALLAVPAVDQLQILAQARRTAFRSRQALAFVLSWTVLLVFLVASLWAVRGSVAFWLALAAVFVTGIQIPSLMVRLRLQELLLQIKSVTASRET